MMSVRFPNPNLREPMFQSKTGRIGPILNRYFGNDW